MTSPIVIRVFLFLSVLIQTGYPQVPDTIRVNYLDQEITIDGDFSDWNLDDTLTFRFTDQAPLYNNLCAVKLAWDDLNLYGIFIVYDRHLIGLEPPNAFPRLHYNDGVELYFDSKNDSHDTMNINDYQFLIDLKGNGVIFKGDRLDQKLKFMVPKEYGTANIVFQSAAKQWGTINKIHDLDSMYCVEFAISWSSIGVKPKKDMNFKVDFCVNDNDTLVNFRDLKPGPVKHYSFMSINGSRDFGFPQNWLKMVLRGEPSFITKLNKKYSHEWLYLFFFTFIVGVFIILFFYLRIRRLQRIPQKADLVATPLLNSILQKYPPDDKKTENPIVGRARDYILKHIDEPLKPDKLASELAVSLRNLQRIFNQELNTTPGNFILLIKMEKAADLLSMGQRSVTEISDDLGFNDPAYFSRVFKKYFGISPKEFRKT